MNQSYASYFLSLPVNERQTRLSRLNSAEKERLRYNWQFWRRPNQTPPPGNWRIWLILAGRGFGKTRTGAEQVRAWVKDYRYVNLIGATADDARDIMIEGESGILAVCPKDERPAYIKNAAKLAWPNGATSLVFTAAEPDRLRGKQHMKLWEDELAAWRYPEAHTQAMLGMRLGDDPQTIITTTPKPTKEIKELLADTNTITTKGSTYDNRPNLASAFFDEVIKRYEGTRLGRQELNAELLEDIEGALWRRDQIDNLRVSKFPALIRVVVGVDPEATSGENSAETGIVTAGIDGDGHIYVLDDNSLRGRPEQWAKEAIAAYYRHRADRVIGEVNNGGEMIESVLRVVERSVSYKAVRATRGKVIRAEPIAALYEQGRAHHVGTFPSLEDQMCTWEQGQTSPDRLDALVWAVTELMTGGAVQVVDDPFSDW